jgi:hypothetical protein
MLDSKVTRFFRDTIRGNSLPFLFRLPPCSLWHFAAELLDPLFLAEVSLASALDLKMDLQWLMLFLSLKEIFFKSK